MWNSDRIKFKLSLTQNYRNRMFEHNIKILQKNFTLSAWKLDLPTWTCLFVNPNLASFVTVFTVGAFLERPPFTSFKREFKHHLLKISCLPSLPIKLESFRDIKKPKLPRKFGNDRFLRWRWGLKMSNNDPSSTIQFKNGLQIKAKRLQNLSRDPEGTMKIDLQIFIKRKNLHFHSESMKQETWKFIWKPPHSFLMKYFSRKELFQDIGIMIVQRNFIDGPLKSYFTDLLTYWQISIPVAFLSIFHPTSSNFLFFILNISLLYLYIFYVSYWLSKGHLGKFVNRTSLLRSQVKKELLKGRK